MSLSPSPSWLTVAPMHYREDGGFWDRDPGLLALSFRDLGVDCSFVAFGDKTPETNRPLILGSPRELEDPGWWGQWKADCVVLYSWGMPRYEPIARAIKEAGSQLMVCLDSDGIVSPRVDFGMYYLVGYWLYKDVRYRGVIRLPAALAAAAKACLHYCVPASYDLRMIRHLQHANLISVGSPLAVERIKRLMMAYRRPELAERVVFLPHPVVTEMTYDSSVPKQRSIVAVGRWESFQKDAPLLMRVLVRVLKKYPSYQAQILGSGGEYVNRLRDSMAGDVASRVHVVGPVPHRELVSYYRASQVIFAPSRYESFHIACAEALCCGCSVVGSATVAPLWYFCSRASGTLALRRTADELDDALSSELAAWQEGGRDPSAISAFGCSEFHAPNIAKRLIDQFSPFNKGCDR